MAIAAGVGLPYETLTGDLRDVNDRVIRVILNEFRRRIEQRQEAVFIHQLCRPVRNAWLDAAVLSGALALPGYAASLYWLAIPVHDHGGLPWVLALPCPRAIWGCCGMN